MSKERFRCSWCGRFIPIKDLDEGTATIFIIFCDSEFSVEENESVCKKCHKENPNYCF